MGREIDLNPKVLITAYPVRGLDIGSSYTIYDLLQEQKRKGVGILYIGEDLDVLLELCDRILVLCGGKATAIIPAPICHQGAAGHEDDRRAERGGNGGRLCLRKPQRPLCMWCSGPALPRPSRSPSDLAAIVLALVTGGLFLLALERNPLDIYGTMVSGALGSSIAFRETVKITIPLCVTALGVTLAFKMKFWNIGAEGQICMGADCGQLLRLYLRQDVALRAADSRHADCGHSSSAVCGA